MGASDTEEIKTGTLRFEYRAAADSSNFDARHGNAELEIAVQAVCHQHGPQQTRLLPYFRMVVIQLLLSTFCAGS